MLKVLTAEFVIALRKRLLKMFIPLDSWSKLSGVTIKESMRRKTCWIIKGVDA
jgi:hypothetical protein